MRERDYARCISLSHSPTHMMTYIHPQHNKDTHAGESERERERTYILSATHPQWLSAPHSILHFVAFLRKLVGDVPNHESIAHAQHVTTLLLLVIPFAVPLRK